MVDKLRERDKGEEARYKMAEEQSFKIRARRNKLVGFWIAEQIGLDAENASSYATELVMAAMDLRDDAALAAHIAVEYQRFDLSVSVDDIRREFEKAQTEAVRQITAQYPLALDGDHERVGG